MRSGGWWAIALAVLLPTSSCQFIGSLLFPTQQLQLINQTTTTVQVRIGRFAPGKPLVTDAEALQKATLAPSEATSFRLPIDHYEVFAASTDASGADAFTDVSLHSSQSSTLTLAEQIEDRTGTHDIGQGFRTRQLGWLAN